MTILTAHQKCERGLTLTAADIKELLNDPNSWVAKLYADCLLIAAVTTDHFIHLVNMVIQEHRLSNMALEKQRLRDMAQESEADAFYYNELYQSINSAQAGLATQQNQTPGNAVLDALQTEMRMALIKPQYRMSLAQLANHHKEITTNFNNQISAALGTTLTLRIDGQANPLSLTVPQLTAKPIASVADLLSHNTTLRDELNTDSAQRLHFTKHAVLAGMGHLAVINKMREILEFNKELLKQHNIDADAVCLSPKMLKQVDQATLSCLAANPQLLPHLFENNYLAMNKLAALPSRLTMRPEPQAKALDEDELVPAFKLR